MNDNNDNVRMCQFASLEISRDTALNSCRFGNPLRVGGSRRAVLQTSVSVGDLWLWCQLHRQDKCIRPRGVLEPAPDRAQPLARQRRVMAAGAGMSSVSRKGPGLSVRLGGTFWRVVAAGCHVKTCSSW